MKLPLVSACSATMLALVSLLSAGPGQPYPIQQRPGPDGYPNQNPATFPKSVVPPQAPRFKLVPNLPALVELGNGDYSLRGAWKMAFVMRVAGTGLELSKPGFNTSGWYDATVPGTTLTTLVDRGVYPEPTYALNNMAIPEWLNREDYWYRQEFTADSSWKDRHVTLRLLGVNYAGDVWFNGVNLGQTRGAFIRGEFDVTSLLKLGETNVLVVRASPPPHPGIPHEESLAAGSGVPNGGAMTLDGPTFFCTEGWDWIPGIRDRNTGLWQEVQLHVGGPVRIGDAYVISDLPLPSLDSAELSVVVPLRNLTEREQNVTVSGVLEGKSFSKTVTLAAGASTETVITPADTPVLKVSNPRLWWPNGYGKPELYQIKLSAKAGNSASDERQVRFGIREVSYELSAWDGDNLRRVEFNPTAAKGAEVVRKDHANLRGTGNLYAPTLAKEQTGISDLKDDGTGPFLILKVNGVRIVVRGGNWGFSEALKRNGREQMEPFFRLERDANLNLIRNWCGQNMEPTFFELADEYGLMVWSDFWLSTQDWNMQPLDIPVFLSNAEDSIRRYRSHPSLVIWCGRNEGVPPPVLNEGLDALIRRHDPSRYFQPTSVALNLLWSGPWVHGDPKNFYTNYGIGFSTELGLPSVPTADAIRAMMPPEDHWPINDTWAYHDWHTAHHGEIAAFVASLNAQFGEGISLDDFARKAQMINYVGHRAMFEGLNAHLWAPSSGRIIWMSHPTWGSMTWQLYSFDTDTHGSYYGAKKAMEPLHVQLNLHDHELVVTNTTRSSAEGTVEAIRYAPDGRELSRQSVKASTLPNQMVRLGKLDESKGSELALTFVGLVWKDASGSVLSRNFYWLPVREEDTRILKEIPRVAIKAKMARLDGGKAAELTLVNDSKNVALMIKPTLREASGQRVLPAYWEDGYISLAPGETRTIKVDCGELRKVSQVTLDGWNVTDTVWF